MHGYFISPPGETAWTISPEVLAHEMRTRWPDATIEFYVPTVGSKSLMFEVTFFDEAYSHEIAVLGDTTEEELYGPFLA